MSTVFSSRGFNIDSITVGSTEYQGLSKIIMILLGDNQTIEQITKQPATDSSIESMETLVNRYIQLTPPKLLTKIKAELNIYNSKDYNSINL